MPRLFVFGLGYTARALAGGLLGEGWRIAGTCRDAEGRTKLAAMGIEAVPFDGAAPIASAALAGTTHILGSIPPDPDDPALGRCGAEISALPDLAWIGYLSTTSVYGVSDGSTVDEETPCSPASARGRRRLAAERAWQSLPLPAHVFRLSGIYGPGRSVFDAIRAGRARRIVKPGQVFNRIHVEDIAATLRASIERPRPGRIYNLADDLPAPSADPVAHACKLLGIEPPPEVPFDEATLSDAAREFWTDNKRVSNRRIKDELGVRLAYPTYREGLQAICEAER